MDRVVAYMDDLMFLSRIREAARDQDLEVQSVRNVPDLVQACRPAPRVILMDLDSPHLSSGAALSALQADPQLAAIPVVGFFGHVHAERGREASRAGCTRVLPRSVFVQELVAILGASRSRG